jgi:hypothetical protein
MHLRSWSEAATKRLAGAIGEIGLRVLRSEFVTPRGLSLCVLLVLCIRHAVASISV